MYVTNMRHIGRIHYYYNGSYMGIVNSTQAGKIIGDAMKEGASILHDFDDKQKNETIRITSQREQLNSSS